VLKRDDSPPDHSGLIESMRAGDQLAFERLYRETVGMVYGLCLRMTSNPSLAEECVQQTYVQAWRNLDGFRGESAVGTWLHRIAVNEVRSQFRRESRHQSLDVEVEHPVDASDTGHQLDLERAIATLPDQARAVFVLVAVYGYPHQEAADMLDIAEGTSKAHYHHARRRLRDLLGESHESDR